MNQSGKDSEKRGNITAEDVRISISKRRAKKSSNEKLIRAGLIVLVSCMIMSLVVAVFFTKIKSINVRADDKYKAEQIIKDAELEKGMNFFSVNTKKVVENIKSRNPSITEVQVEKKFPSTINITLKESDAAMYVAVGENYYTLSEDLTVLEKHEKYDESVFFGLTRLYVPDISRCIAGETIVSEDEDCVEMIIELYDALSKHELIHEVGEIDFIDKFDIKFTLGVRYTVKLGVINEVDTKLEFLKGIVEKLGENDVGTIDFSHENINEAVFTRS